MPRRFSHLVFCISIAVLVFTSFAALGTVINVPADQPTIQAAINAAVNGDTVLVAPGTYIESINFKGKAITVKSSNGASVTIIDGGGIASVVTFKTNETSTSRLSGFTLQHGISTVNSLYRGAGVFVYFASPLIKGNVIQNNNACIGGGIGVYYGSPVIRGNTIKNNSMNGCSGGSGAISVEGPGSTEIIGNTIRDNTANSGNCGGILLGGAGSTTIQNNIIAGNVVTGLSPASVGGGICMENILPADAVIIQNLMYGNTAGQGAGIYAFVPSGARPLFINNTIVGSASSPQGSAVYITGYDDQAQFFNNVMIGPSGTNAVYCDTLYDQNPPTFTNNDAYSANGTGLQGTCSGESGTNGNISADPLFVNVSNNNYRPLGGSPVIDVGDNSAPSLPAFDLAGNRRIINGNNGPTAIVDMGAYEFIPVILSPKSLSFGLQAVDSTTSKTVTLANKQNKVLTISSDSVPTGYSVTGCGASVAAFSSCTLTVTFNPLTSCTFNGTLNVTDDAGNSPQAVALSGSAQ